jgi:arylsulfatase A-like enzyme
MELSEQLSWLGISALLSMGYLAISALIAWAIGRRSHGLLFSALIFVHAALIYRFDFVVNHYARDPVVWGGILFIGLVCLGLGWMVDRIIVDHRRRLLFGLLGLGLLGVLLTLVRSHGEDVGARADQKNVLLITLDTTRPDALSAYGSENATPALEALAAQGVIFDQAIASAPLTEPSHLAILTGNPPVRTGVVSNGTDLGEQPGMLTHKLRAEGWTTGAFVSAFPLHARYGWDQAFDVYDDDFGDVPGLHRLSLVKAWDQVSLPAHTLRERRGDRTVSRALNWLESHQTEPFFLWVHLFDPHAPYEAPDHPFNPPTDGEELELPGYWPPPHRAITSTDWLTEAYEAEIRYVDGQVERLLDRLDQLGLSDSTIVMVSADHGESLTEHGYLFDHGDDLYDPSLAVPWIVRAPGVTVSGTRVACQVGNIDVAPTVLSLLGIADETDRMGVDRSPELRGEDCRSSAVVATTVAGRYVETPPIDHALRTDGYKRIRHEEGEPECYDLDADPGELSDLGTACPEALETQLEAVLEFGADPQAASQDSESRQALEALGYIE